MAVYHGEVLPVPTTRRELEREIMRLHYALRDAWAERDRLRDALATIHFDAKAKTNAGANVKTIQAICKSARAALEGK